ncbi:MAG: hypothetical protein ACTSO9_15970 [Candidatus Helarchaeota archaeon]
MNEINGFWILEPDGNILFQHELFVQGSEDFDSALLSGVILAVQSFVKNLGEEKVKQMELGKSKIFILRDNETDLILVLKTEKKVKTKKYYKLLEKLQEKIQQIYTDKIFSKKELREYLITSFHKDFDELMGISIKQRMSDFFKAV